jgi:Flp pilus assembly protein TadG
MNRSAASESKDHPDGTSTHRGRESGFTSVELAIVAPLLLMMIFSIVHIGMLFHSRNAANDVANATLREAQRQGSAPGDPQRSGDALAKKYGTSLAHTTIRVSPPNADNEVTVTVTADGIRIVPFLTTRITRTVSGPIERFISEEDRK